MKAKAKRLSNLKEKTNLFYNCVLCGKKQLQKALDSILNEVADWSKEGNNKWWIAGGGLILALLIIRYNKFAIPLILLLVAMIPMLINDQHGQPKYFAQIKNGNITIEIP